MDVRSGEETPVLSIEDRLAQVALIMNLTGMSAALIDGRLGDDRPYEGVSLIHGDLELGQVRFAERTLISKQVDAERIKEERDLMMAGLATYALQEVVSAAQEVYCQDGDLLDERFNVLPGFDS